MAENFLKNTFLSVLLCILFSCSIHTEEDVCIEETPCLCKLNDDRYIDISHIITKDSPYLEASTRDLTYYFYPCKDVKFNATALHIPVNITLDNCSKGTSLCLYNSTEQSLVNLGTTKDLKFSNDYYKSLVYTVNKPKNVTSTILLECAPDAPLSYLISTSHLSDQHQLLLFSPHACIRFEHNSLSTGSTLLVMFCTVFGIYLLGGALILHFLRGARGKEMIPNLDFWVDLPCLVRDGTVFLLNGCNPLSVSTAETYDRI